MKTLKDFLKLRNFIALWFGQSVSALGSSMTSFAVAIWAYEKTGNVLTLSISGILIMVPKMLGSILAGPFVDRASKKKIMILTDIGAGICTFIMFMLIKSDSLEVWHIYVLNFAISVLGSFQRPASDVAFSLTVPKEYYIKANGIQSFSSGIIEILSPVFAVALLSLTGIVGVIIVDFTTLAIACLSLVFLVKIPEKQKSKDAKFVLKDYIEGLKSGFRIIKESKLLRTLMLLMAFINFVAGLTYFNLINPMILARSGNDAKVLAFVNGALGLGGVVGGLLVAIIPQKNSRIKSIFFCLGLSFLLGDIMFALGKSVPVWGIAGFLSCVFLPVYNANQSYIWRTRVPVDFQGRVFSFKYAIQSGMVPVGMIIGGTLADFVFEPFMNNSANPLSLLVGNTEGSGMALMFLITGVLGTMISIIGFFSGSLRTAEKIECGR